MSSSQANSHRRTLGHTEPGVSREAPPLKIPQNVQPLTFNNTIKNGGSARKFGTNYKLTNKGTQKKIIYIDNLNNAIQKIVELWSNLNKIE